jgi:hypothetical protein
MEPVGRHLLTGDMEGRTDKVWDQYYILHQVCSARYGYDFWSIHKVPPSHPTYAALTIREPEVTLLQTLPANMLQGGNTPGPHRCRFRCKAKEKYQCVTPPPDSYSIVY